MVFPEVAREVAVLGSVELTVGATVRSLAGVLANMPSQAGPEGGFVVAQRALPHLENNVINV